MVVVVVVVVVEVVVVLVVGVITPTFPIFNGVLQIFFSFSFHWITF